MIDVLSPSVILPSATPISSTLKSSLAWANTDAWPKKLKSGTTVPVRDDSGAENCMLPERKAATTLGAARPDKVDLCSLVFISHQRPDNRYDCEPQQSQPSNCKNPPGFADEEPKLDRADDDERQTSKSTVKETGAPVRWKLQCTRPTMRRLLDCVFAHRRAPYRNAAAAGTAEPNVSAAICAWSNSTCG